MEELTEGETEGQDNPQSSQKMRAEEGEKTRADPVQASPRDHQSPTRVGTTIYMETVNFLLQSYALQVIQSRTTKYNTLFPRTTVNILSSAYFYTV